MESVECSPEKRTKDIRVRVNFILRAILDRDRNLTIHLTLKQKEITYYVLTKFEPNMSDEYLRLGKFYGDVVFRGVKYGNMLLSGHKEDFQLIPKEEEKFFLEKTLPDGKLWREPTMLPKFTELPPLLKEMLKQEAISKNVAFKIEELKLPLLIKERKICYVKQE